MVRASACLVVLVLLAGCTRDQEHYAVGPYPSVWYRQPNECTVTEYQGDLQVIGEEGKAIGYLRHEWITVTGQREPRDQWWVMNDRFERVGMVGNKGETFRFSLDGNEWKCDHIGDMAPDAAARLLLRYPGKVVLLSASATPQPPAEPQKPKPKEGEPKPADQKPSDQKPAEKK